MTSPRLSLVSTQTAITYSFRADAGQFGWACCTVNDATGELLITSDWGNWSHRWSADPNHLGAPSLTAFIGTRGDVDYLARKLQREGHAGRRWSAKATATALRRRLCERRLEDGRAQIEDRLDPEELPLVPLAPFGRYTADGLPIYSPRYVRAPTWKDPDRVERLPYLTRETARRLWDQIGRLGDELDRSNGDLFYERVQQIDSFVDYVTEEPWEYGKTEQTPEDKALRDIVLPALIEACCARAGAPPAAGAADDEMRRESDRDVIARHAATIAELRSEARALYAKLRATTARLADWESTETLETEIARFKATLERLGAYCATTPCGCPCHAGAAAPAATTQRPPCTNNSPPGFTGHWRDWHRGHGCDKDDGKPRTQEGAAR